MSVTEVARMILRHWLLLILGVLISAGLTTYAFISVPSTYASTGVVMLLQQSTTSVPGGENPYLVIDDSLGVTAAAVLRAVSDSPTMGAEVVAIDPHATFLITPVMSGPFLQVDTEANTPANALAIQTLTLEEMGKTLTHLQVEVGAPTKLQIRLSQVSTPTKPKVVLKRKIQLVGAVLFGGLALTFSSIFLIDRIRSGRRGRKGAAAQPQPTPVSAPAPANEGRPVPAPARPVMSPMNGVSASGHQGETVRPAELTRPVQTVRQQPAATPASSPAPAAANGGSSNGNSNGNGSSNGSSNGKQRPSPRHPVTAATASVPTLLPVRAARSDGDHHGPGGNQNGNGQRPNRPVGAKGTQNGSSRSGEHPKPPFAVEPVPPFAAGVTPDTEVRVVDPEPPTMPRGLAFPSLDSEANLPRRPPSKPTPGSR